MTFEKGEKFARDRGMRFFETRCGPPDNSWLGALTHHPIFRINSMMNDFCVHVDELGRSLWLPICSAKVNYSVEEAFIDLAMSIKES